MTGTYVQIATPAASATSYIDNGVRPNSTYYYRLVAVNAVGPSLSSNTVSITPR